MNKTTTHDSLKFFYTNADHGQFTNKRDDLLMIIANDLLDIILINETIPKAYNLHPLVERS